MPKSKSKSKSKCKPVPKRVFTSTLESSTTPPPELTPTQTLARVVKAEGNHLYSIVLPRSDTLGGNRDLNPSSNPNPNSGPDLDADLMDGKQGDGEMCLVELMPALRSRVFLRRNGYVLVDLDRGLLGGRENKIVGVVVGVVLGGRMEREWRGMGYWPAEFVRVRAWDDVDDSGEGPRMPESGDDDDDDDDEKGEDG